MELPNFYRKDTYRENEGSEEITSINEFFVKDGKLLAKMTKYDEEIGTQTMNVYITNGKACYVISEIFPEERSFEVYIEKDTGIGVKTTGNAYAPCEVEYEIGNVKNEVFVEPNLKDYEIVGNK